MPGKISLPQLVIDELKERGFSTLWLRPERLIKVSGCRGTVDQPYLYLSFEKTVLTIRMVFNSYCNCDVCNTIGYKACTINRSYDLADPKCFNDLESRFLAIGMKPFNRS